MNKKGFTLVELLAVVAILAIIMVIAVPKIIDSIDQSKKKSFFSSAKSIIREIDYNSIDSLTVAETALSDLNINGISSDNYDLSLSTAYLVNDTIYLNLVGKGKFEGLYMCEVTEEVNENATQESPCIVYKESILNGAYPRIGDGMIPVTIANNGTVTTVDPTSSSWYNYTNKQWANVVLVKETGTQSRDYYQSNYGVTVAEADILAYLVWIPRYRYTLWNVAGTTPTQVGGCSVTSYYSQSTCEANAAVWTVPACTANCPQAISITFEPATATKSTGSTNGTQLTHQAFTFDGKELNGIWVGKFETTPIAGSACATSPGTTNCLNVDPTIKPNVNSLRYQNVLTQFNTSLKFMTETMYGLMGESRMSKNSDWGAITYLSHSVYGINTEIRINNKAYQTGCGATIANSDLSATCQIVYGSVSSYPQSTTGNISGIFDMAGGAYEYQMGVYTNTTNDKYSGRCDIYNSGYNGIYGEPTYTGCNASLTSKTDGADYPNEKYYKTYINTNYQSNVNYLGEALGETRGWYKDSYGMVYLSYVWSVRGGVYNTGIQASGFYFSYQAGYSNSAYSFRTIVTTR